MIRTFYNGTTVNVDPDVFIFTGCWILEEICARQKCYADEKCNCAKNQYCIWNNDKNECVSDQAECIECASYGQYCK